jgi:hypothetical protein
MIGFGTTRNRKSRQCMIELHPEILTTDGKPQFAVLPYDEFS